MTTKQQINIGMIADVEDATAGVPASYHVVSAVYLDYANQYYTVTVDSYFNQNLFGKGKKALSSMQLTLSAALPRGVDVLDWAFKELVGGGAGNSPFSGAQLVYSAQADGSGVVGND